MATDPFAEAVNSNINSLVTAQANPSKAKDAFNFVSNEIKTSQQTTASSSN